MQPILGFPMLNVPREADDVRIILFDDDETPHHFVVDLLRSIFGKSDAEAAAIVAVADAQGQAVCGPYPAQVAAALLSEAQARIKEHGLPLTLNAEPFGGTVGGADRCAFCGKLERPGQRLFKRYSAAICHACMVAGANHFAEASKARPFKYAHQALAWHFTGTPRDQIVSTSRQFPGHIRADVQLAVDQLFATPSIRFFGIYEQHRYETLTFASLTRDGDHAH